MTHSWLIANMRHWKPTCTCWSNASSEHGARNDLSGVLQELRLPCTGVAHQQQVTLPWRPDQLILQWLTPTCSKYIFEHNFHIVMSRGCHLLFLIVCQSPGGGSYLIRVIERGFSPNSCILHVVFSPHSVHPTQWLGLILRVDLISCWANQLSWMLA